MNYLRGFLRIVRFIFLTVAVLLLLLFFALQITSVKQWLGKKSANYISEKTHSKVIIGELGISFPLEISLNEVFFEDEKHDTLLQSQKIKLDLSLFNLIAGNIQLRSLSAETGTINISRSGRDTLFNYQFILNAFSSSGSQANSGSFIINNIILNGIHLFYFDSKDGIDLNIRTGQSNIAFSQFNTDENKYTIDVISLKGSRIKYTENPGSPSTGKKSNSTDINIRNIIANSVSLDYQSKPGDEKLILAIGHANIYVNRMDMNRKIMDINELTLKNSSVNYEPVAKTNNQAQKGEAWQVKATKINLVNNKIKYNDPNKAYQEGFDPNHLDLADFSATASNFNFKTDLLVDIASLSFREKKGLVINNFSSNLRYTGEAVELKKLTLSTPHSHISNYIKIGLADSVKDIKLNARLKNTWFSFRDIAYFQPSVLKEKNIQKLLNKRISINGSFDGKINDLAIDNAKVGIPQSTFIDFKGNIKGLPDLANAYYNLDIKNAASSASDIFELSPDSLIPKNISIPPYIHLSGNFIGTQTNFDTRLSVNSSYGNCDFYASVLSEKNHSAYVINGRMEDFNLGLLLKNPLLGKTTLSANIKGNDFGKADQTVHIASTIEYLRIRNYDYRDGEADITYKDSSLLGVVKLNDKNLKFNADGMVNISTLNPSIKGSLDISHAYPKAIGLIKDSLVIKSLILADLKGNSVNHLKGTLKAEKSVLEKDGRIHMLDSLIILGINNDNNTDVTLQSEMITANIKGDVKFTDIPVVVNNHFNHYFNFADLKTIPVKKESGFTFNFIVNAPDSIISIFNSDINLKPFVLKGNYNGSEENFKMEGNFPGILYAGTKLDSVHIDSHSDKENMYYSVQSGGFKNKSVSLKKPLLEGKIHNDKIDIALTVLGTDTDKFIFGGTLKKAGPAFIFNTSKLVIDDKTWNVNTGNYIQFTGKDFFVHDLNFEKNDSSVYINSVNNSYNSPLRLDLKKFNISLISRMLKSDTVTWKGIADGFVQLEELEKNPGFTANLRVKSLSYRNDSLGDLTLNASQKINEKYAIMFSLLGHGNNIKGKGYYIPSFTNNSLDVDLDVAALNIKTAEQFSKGFASKLSGLITSKLKLTGTPVNPLLNGYIEFKNVVFNLDLVNTKYKIVDERIDIVNDYINFNSFEVLDSLKNKAFITGYIFTNSYKEIQFNLDVISKDFLALNSLRKKNSQFFGTAYIDSHIHIAGNSNRPVIDIKAKFNEGSRLTIILPDENREIKTSSGVVEFVNLKSGAQQNASISDTTSSPLKNIDLTANVEIDEKTSLRLIVDEEAGDSLFVKGKTTFSFSLDPSGKNSLTGVYEIFDGAYYVSLNNYIRKKFIVQKGSKISWTGDPFNADLDITAIYTVRASAYDLMEPQLLTLSELEKNKFKQRLPFEVHLFLKNKLLHPDINFEVNLPQSQQGVFGGTVYARLNQLNQVSSELNRQVFALLILNRFLGQNPFASPGQEFSSVARISVSKILSQQLNLLSSTYIQKVNFDFNLNSYQDYSTGVPQGKTDLLVGAGTDVLDNRLNIQADGIVDLQGKSSQPTTVTSSDGKTISPGTTNNGLVSDLTMIYNLTQDGIYKLKAARRSGYVGVFDGEISENILSIIFTRDYNNFKELFRRPEEEHHTPRRSK